MNTVTVTNCANQTWEETWLISQRQIVREPGTKNWTYERDTAWDDHNGEKNIYFFRTLDQNTKERLLYYEGTGDTRINETSGYFEKEASWELQHMFRVSD